MKYRADIDGLRAIAILLVLVYHGGLSCFPSGFIGVDVFFVISGFLITGIIHESLNNGHFSFIDFYNRRLWRLQPVFVCFLIVTTALSLLFFLPDDLIQYIKSARKASLFIANSFFSKTTTGYFAPNTHQLPLLHTWSLAIEWQCYLILPLVMYGLHLLFKRYLFGIVLALTLICLSVSLYYSQMLPVQTYYQFSSRVFEFLIGACIALLPLRPIAMNQHLLNAMGFLALASLFYIAGQSHILLGYPNGYALGACLATGILIGLGTFFPTQPYVKILSFKPLVFIGVLSYSLYIWHWAIFALLRYYNVSETPIVLFIVYGLTFIIAYLSWKFIEKPARQFKTLKFHYTLVSLVLLPIGLIHLMSHLITAYEGLPERFDKELVNVYQQLDQYASQQRPKCIRVGKLNSDCRIGSKEMHAKTGLMIGDSFSNHYWGFMDTLGQDAKVSILAQGISSCLTLPGIYLYDWWNYKRQIYQECSEQTQTYYRLIQEHHYDYVIIGQLWDNYLSDKLINKLGDKRSLSLTKKRLAVALDKALALITASGSRPVLIETSALMQKNFHDCFFKHIKMRLPYEPEECNFNFTLSNSERWFKQLFAKMQIKYPQLILIDPKKVQCPGRRCKAEINGIPVYRDVGHITDYASYQFGRQYLKEFDNPLT